MERPPFPKKKVALLLAYSGANYSGLQLNPGATTIESVVMEAAGRAGLIWERNQGDPKKIDWQRSCRTDKGVHAAGNVISFKALLVGKEGENGWSSEYAVGLLNKYLPVGIRCLDLVKVTNSFDAHIQCDSRFYEYIFPACLLGEDNLQSFLSKTVTLGTGTDDDGEDQTCVQLTSEELEYFKTFRLSPDRLQALNMVLNCYVGTKSFHNFTIAKSPSDPSSQRFIRSFSVVNSFLNPDNIEWVRVRVHGASFMMHQIRKMVALAILAVRFSLDGKRLVADALNSEVPVKWNIPKAPGVGLYLDKAVFDGYNKYLEKTTAAGVPDCPIDFDRYGKEREEIKREIIYPAIFEPGVAQFAHWVKGIQAHNYEFGYLSNYQ